MLPETARVTSAGGWLVLDFLHASLIRRSVVRSDCTQVGVLTVNQRRQITPSGRFVVKDIQLGGEDRVFTERVRLFGPSDLAAMIDGCGYAVRRVFGDYHGRPLAAQSPRVVIFAQRR